MFTELRRRNISTTANKEELIERLLFQISERFPNASYPGPPTPFPVMPAFTDDSVENMRLLVAFLHQNMGVVKSALGCHISPVSLKTLPDLSALLSTFSGNGTLTLRQSTEELGRAQRLVRWEDPILLAIWSCMCV